MFETIIESIKTRKKELGAFKFYVLFIGFFISTTLFLFMGLNAIFHYISNRATMILCLAALLPCTISFMLYSIYLNDLMGKRQELKKEELVTPAKAREVLIQTSLEELELMLQKMEEKEAQLIQLKEKAYKSSNPFLINKYIRLKRYMEYASFQVEMYTEFLNRETVDQIRQLARLSENREGIKIQDGSVEAVEVHK